MSTIQTTDNTTTNNKATTALLRRIKQPWNGKLSGGYMDDITINIHFWATIAVESYNRAAAQPTPHEGRLGKQTESAPFSSGFCITVEQYHTSVGQAHPRLLVLQFLHSGLFRELTSLGYQAGNDRARAHDAVSTPSDQKWKFGANLGRNLMRLRCNLQRMRQGSLDPGKRHDLHRGQWNH
ncbi:hypothetical protein PAAG_12319 [Paracoccidioides lutzii Pb01]|uniref:Uncharacterized protein n=1 Tax=Paracoccidioides lutzii (strain ATCC MYA-826 / Pb01) TaxID=502779 RepID=A0A0A2V3Q3_PARBA|nr:hypothetical protein PAAG_12319 [Paracoccidioides lutzii Pb01]KGQ01007.1 hypothetical protein PAAG_12319 [Paracoccidioides lutzii Pb01]